MIFSSSSSHVLKLKKVIANFSLSLFPLDLTDAFRWRNVLIRIDSLCLDNALSKILTFKTTNNYDKYIFKSFIRQMRKKVISREKSILVSSLLSINDTLQLCSKNKNIFVKTMRLAMLVTNVTLMATNNEYIFEIFCINQSVW